MSIMNQFSENHPISEGVASSMRKWRGTIGEKFSNISNLVSLVKLRQDVWNMPVDLYTQLCGNHERLQALIPKSRSISGSKADRALRNTLLKDTVDLCNTQVKMWAYGKYTAGIMTADDVHLLGFRLPGEIGRHHSRTEATNIEPEVMVKIINEDFIRVVVSNTAGKNSAQAGSGWPPGVKFVQIVITADDGTTEVLRINTSRMYNTLRMPEGSHGKQFLIKAAFLRHVDDEPRFGNEPMFSMPLTMEDLIVLKRRHQEEIGAHEREVERLLNEVAFLRQENERLRAEAAKR
jgi:hypothetical protein